MKTYLQTDKLNWETTKIKGFSSKQLLELPLGGFKMIRVAPKSTYPLHLHPDKTEFIFVLEGQVNIINGDESQNGAKNDFFTLPSNTKHSIVNSFEEECTLLVGAIQTNC